MLLLLLTGFIVAMGYYACLARYRSSKPPVSPYGYSQTIDYVAGFSHGGFMYHQTDPSTHLYHLRSTYLHHSAGKWSITLGERMGFKPKPEVTFVDWQGIQQKNEPYLFVPLWPLIIILAILWPIWMHQTEKKEMKRYSQPSVNH
ncbi:hypothetical protein [Haloferula sp.]|uniref:hypothetical protein n=1 Tax=Haloferula sp. TaxID=2497595 RepID=UPI0032A07D82